MPTQLLKIKPEEAIKWREMAGTRSTPRNLILLLATGGFLLAGLMFDYMPAFVDQNIKRQVELATNDDILAYWTRPPISIDTYFWLYEVLNANQFQTNAERIQVKKVGPFHFSSHIEKKIISLSANKFRLTYNSTRISHLNQSYPNNLRLLDRPLTLVNPIYGTVLEASRMLLHRQLLKKDEAEGEGSVGSSTAAPADGPSLLADPQRTLAVGLGRILERNNETLFLNISARTALLGRRLIFLEKIKRLVETFELKADIPDVVSADNKFGYASINNATWLGPYEIYTGYRETAPSLGELISYQGRRRLTTFEGRCNRLQVSAGELRPMPVSEWEQLEMWAPQLCRAVRLKPSQVYKLREGQAISYKFAESEFQSANANPDNRCFCLNSTLPYNGRYCSLDGVIELAPCSYDAPLLITMPHISLDPRISSTIANWSADLLRPDSDQLNSLQSNYTETQLLVLKRIGVPAFADITLTILMRLVRDPKFKQVSNVPEVSYVPLVTIREVATIPANLAEIIVNVERAIALTYHLKVVMYLSAVMLIFWLLGGCYGAPVESSAAGRPQEETNDEEQEHDGGQRQQSAAAAAAAAAAAGPPKRRASQQKLTGGRVSQQLRATAKTPAAEGTAAVSSADATPSDQIRGRASSRKSAASVHPIERANSADSNRSQPASSRQTASRLNSLDELADETQQQQQQQRNTEAEQELDQETGSGGQLIGVGGRMFSEVDEELERRRQKRDSRKLSQRRPTGSRRPNDKLASKADDGEREIERCDAADDEQEIDKNSARPESETENENDTGGRTHDNDDQKEQQQQQRRRRRRPRRAGWFVSVYSSFARLLGGIRTTISDLGQIHAADDTDYQDKQLEMLADKIDNWYIGQEAAAAGGDIGGDVGGGGSGGGSGGTATPPADHKQAEGRAQAEQPTEAPPGGSTQEACSQWSADESSRAPEPEEERERRRAAAFERIEAALESDNNQQQQQQQVAPAAGDTQTETPPAQVLAQAAAAAAAAAQVNQSSGAVSSPDHSQPIDGSQRQSPGAASDKINERTPPDRRPGSARAGNEPATGGQTNDGDVGEPPEGQASDSAPPQSKAPAGELARKIFGQQPKLDSRNGINKISSLRQGDALAANQQEQEQQQQQPQPQQLQAAGQ